MKTSIPFSGQIDVIGNLTPLLHFCNASSLDCPLTSAMTEADLPSRCALRETLSTGGLGALRIGRTSGESIDAPQSFPGNRLAV